MNWRALRSLTSIRRDRGVDLGEIADPVDGRQFRPVGPAVDGEVRAEGHAPRVFHESLLERPIEHGAGRRGHGVVAG